MLKSEVPQAVSNRAVINPVIRRFAIFTWLVLSFFALLAGDSAAQSGGSAAKSQEISEIDGIPVLVKHLPDWERVRQQAVFANNAAALKQTLSNKPVVDLIDFAAGTEAVTAKYDAGRLLIVEFPSPQQSVEADTNFRNFLAQNNDGRTFYKRTGNYNIFVFDASSEEAANGLIDQVKYEKNIQWLGEDPFLFRNLERAFVRQTSDLFFSTVEAIALGMGLSVLGGLVVGFVYFQFRERRRAGMKEFSDAGGMTRLNLDGFTPEMSASRLLNE